MLKYTHSFVEKSFIILAVMISTLVLAFLILPILAIVPLSFTDDSLLSYPISDWSLRWYRTLWETPCGCPPLRTV